MKRICYGLAIPGLLASSVIFVHLSAKTVFVRILRGTKHLTSNSWQHWTFWLGLIVINTALAFVLAEGELMTFPLVRPDLRGREPGEEAGSEEDRWLTIRHPAVWRSASPDRLAAQYLPLHVSPILTIGACNHGCRLHMVGESFPRNDANGSSSFPAGCYVWLIWRNNRDVNWEMTVAWSLFIVVLGTFLQVAGSVVRCFPLASSSLISVSYQTSGRSTADWGVTRALVQRVLPLWHRAGDDSQSE